MHASRRLSLAALIAMLAFASGCLVMTSSSKIVHPDARKVAVEFENDQAMQLFARQMETVKQEKCLKAVFVP